MIFSWIRAYYSRFYCATSHVKINYKFMLTNTFELSILSDKNSTVTTHFIPKKLAWWLALISSSRLLVPLCKQ